MLKKIGRAAAVIAALMMCAMLFTGCGTEGTWRAATLEYAGKSIPASELGMDETTIELKSGGQAAGTIYGNNFTGTWAKSGNTVTISSEGESKDFKLENSKLILEEEGGRIIFEKQ